MGLPYSVGHMREVIETLPRNSSPRKRLSLACVQLMRLMREPIDLVEEIKELGRGYGKQSLNPRDIPSEGNSPLTLATSPATIRSSQT